MPIAILVIGVLGSVVLAQGPPTPTLIERAREQGGRVEGESSACGFVGERPTFENIVRHADVIVHGTVVAVAGRLSADGRRVWTDHHVGPIEILRQPSPFSSEPVVFMAEGGTVEVDGLTLIQHFSHNGLHVALQVGDEVIIAGTQAPEGLRVAPINVFIVREGQVRSNGPLPGFGTHDQPLGLVLQRMRELAP